MGPVHERPAPLMVQGLASCAMGWPSQGACVRVLCGGLADGCVCERRSDGVEEVALGDLEKDAELSQLDVAMFTRAPVEAMQTTLAYIRCSAPPQPTVSWARLCCAAAVSFLPCMLRVLQRLIRISNTGCQDDPARHRSL